MYERSARLRATLELASNPGPAFGPGFEALNVYYVPNRNYGNDDSLAWGSLRLAPIMDTAQGTI